MIRNAIIILFLLPIALQSQDEPAIADRYLSEVKTELIKEWPNNRTINLVFHGHSVPAGYFKTPIVNTLGSYPYRMLAQVKKRYPFAVVNIINTSIGGENSVQGADRFEEEVLTHRPDVLFIDYALNDLRVGLEDSRAAWAEMIEKALVKNIKVILLTPSPNVNIDLTVAENELEQHRDQIVELAIKYGVGLADSYAIFKEKAVAGENITDYLSQSNHPNEVGHELIANAILQYF